MIFYTAVGEKVGYQSNKASSVVRYGKVFTGPQKILTFVETFLLSVLPPFPPLFILFFRRPSKDGRLSSRRENANRNCGGFDNGEGRTERREGERLFHQSQKYPARNK